MRKEQSGERRSWFQVVKAAKETDLRLSSVFMKGTWSRLEVDDLRKREGLWKRRSPER